MSNFGSIEKVQDWLDFVNLLDKIGDKSIQFKNKYQLNYNNRSNYQIIAQAVGLLANFLFMNTCDGNPDLSQKKLNLSITMNMQDGFLEIEVNLSTNPT